MYIEQSFSLNKMPLLSITLSLILLFLNQQQFTEAVTLSPVTIPGDGEVGVCPNQEKRDASIQIISDDVVNILRDSAFVRNCGEGLWYQVAYLNMSDPSQQCPSAWREFNSNGIRTCARQISNTGSCPGNIYSVNHQYSRVCGRLLGYQIGSTDAFSLNLALTIDEKYLDGVSITHGMPREHVWSYVAGASEQGSCDGGIRNCPCSPGGPAPPSFVGNNFYCESAYQGDCRNVLCQ